ncbi:MAG: DUF2164 family protein [Spirochaetaceae bacterium]|jgi:uncharacterized protein (DUF2164 family)|nr:DUF2164 family protein [Spirochaetaceae bacterium]
MKARNFTMDKNQKLVLMDKLRSYIEEEWDLQIGDLKADLLVDFLEESLGKAYYNIGIKDTKRYFFKRMEDLEVDIDLLLR